MQNEPSPRRFRPIIQPMSFGKKSQAILPFQYNFSIQQLSEIKKYLHKSLKFIGVDMNGSVVSEQERAILKQNKLKIKAIDGIPNEQTIPKSTADKQTVLMLEWNLKLIHLMIPINSKDTKEKKELQIFEHLSYYFSNYIFLKNNQTEELYFDSQTLLQAQAIATETDIVLNLWSPARNTNDDTFKQIVIRFPIFICLNNKEEYSVGELQKYIKADLLNSLEIIVKNNFDCKVCVIGNSQGRQLICLNSYCKGEDQDIVSKQQQKLYEILGEKPIKSIENTEHNEAERKKQNSFLIGVLVLLVLVYVLLKIYPIGNIGSEGPSLNFTQQPSQVQGGDLGQEENIF